MDLNYVLFHDKLRSIPRYGHILISNTVTFYSPVGLRSNSPKFMDPLRSTGRRQYRERDVISLLKERLHLSLPRSSLRDVLAVAARVRCRDSSSLGAAVARALS